MSQDTDRLLIVTEMELVVNNFSFYIKVERKNNLSYKDFNDIVDQYKENEQARLSYANKLNQLAKEYFQ